MSTSVLDRHQFAEHLLAQVRRDDDVAAAAARSQKCAVGVVSRRELDIDPTRGERGQQRVDSERDVVVQGAHEDVDDVLGAEREDRDGCVEGGAGVASFPHPRCEC